MHKVNLIHERSTLIWGLLAFFLSGTLLALVLFSSLLPNLPIERPAPSHNGNHWVEIGLSAFALLGLYIAATALIEEHQISSKGIISRPALAREKSINWNELKAVKYLGYPRSYFRLESNSGTIIRLSAALKGFPEFAQLLLKNAPSDSIEPATLHVLKATATGAPVPLML